MTSEFAHCYECGKTKQACDMIWEDNLIVGEDICFCSSNCRDSYHSESGGGDGE